MAERPRGRPTRTPCRSTGWREIRWRQLRIRLVARWPLQMRRTPTRQWGVSRPASLPFRSTGSPGLRPRPPRSRPDARLRRHKPRTSPIPQGAGRPTRTPSHSTGSLGLRRPQRGFADLLITRPICSGSCRAGRMKIDPRRCRTAPQARAECVTRSGVTSLLPACGRKGDAIPRVRRVENRYRPLRLDARRTCQASDNNQDFGNAPRGLQEHGVIPNSLASPSSSWDTLRLRACDRSPRRISIKICRSADSHQPASLTSPHHAGSCPSACPSRVHPPACPDISPAASAGSRSPRCDSRRSRR
jgi:hypothetical protein